MPTLDLTSAALAAQARELAARTARTYGFSLGEESELASAITAALVAVCDAARAEVVPKCSTHNRALTHCFYCISAAEIAAVKLRTQLDGERLHAQQIHTGCHAERDKLEEEVWQLRGFVQGWLCGNTVIAGDSRKCCPSWERCASIRQVLAITEPSRG